ncbi:MAG TPA: NfeD family protein [Sphingobium sp.]|nr:NfeD family protein [Sphingobium sp.]
MLDGLFPDEIAPWLAWMILAVALGVGEIALPGVFLIWIAIAAAITGALAFLAPLPVAAQVLLFALLCLASVYLGRRWYRDNPVASADPLLNDRAARLIGRNVTVVEAIVNGEGRVRVDDGTWTALGPDAPIGAQLTVTGAQGATLNVAWPAA